MKLTRYFSRIKANGEFLHEEGMNLPPQSDDREDNSNKIDMGGGFYLKYINGSVGKWIQFGLRKEGVEKSIGYLATQVDPENPEIGPHIGQIWVDDKWRGKHLGEKMIRAFVQLYGGLASDPQGNTSNAAMSMWRKMGAEKIPTDKNYRGFFYILRK
jgi:hypothetical protein